MAKDATRNKVAFERAASPCLGHTPSALYIVCEICLVLTAVLQLDKTWAEYEALNRPCGFPAGASDQRRCSALRQGAGQNGGVPTTRLL